MKETWRTVNVLISAIDGVVREVQLVGAVAEVEEEVVPVEDIHHGEIVAITIAVRLRHGTTQILGIITP